MKSNRSDINRRNALRPNIDKRIVAGVLAVSAALLAVSGMLGYMAVHETQTSVASQFNAEQLVIARNVARLIQGQFNDLKKELTQLTRQVSTKTADPALVDEMIYRCLARVMENGVWKVERIDPGIGVSRIYHPFKKKAEQQLLDEAEKKSDTITSAVTAKGGAAWFSVPEIRPGEIRMQLSAVTRTPSPNILRFHIKVDRFLSPVLRDIRSGKTGYVWIIDSGGIFLFHPDISFIGKNAFVARETKYPDISFLKINFIQKERMLKGYEGTGSYTSGWHRGVTGKIVKLIAYCPLTISRTPMMQWSAAVVAPVTEIEAAVRKGYRRQILLQLLVVLTVMTGASSIIYLEKKWSRRLERIVVKKTEAYKRSEEKYRSLVESADDFIFTVNAQGEFLSLNSFTAKFFGGRPEDFIGRHLSFLVDEAAAKKQMQLIRSVLGFGRSVREEFKLNVGDRSIWLNANFMPLKKRNGETNAILCIARDITENKNLEKQLINTEKLASLGTLAAGVAHEVNNPLGVILGFCDLLLQKTDKDSQNYMDLKTIERQGLHCKQVVENLLSFSRLKNGSVEYADVNRCISDILNVVRHTLEMNDIELNVATGVQLPPVKGDPWQLQQVFLNLINNAAAAMAHCGGTLKIKSRFEKKSRKVLIEFTDTGTGIPTENLDRIFEPFFTTKPEGEGTGLGLFVSYGIITKYGGAIECIRSRSGESAPAGNGGQRGTTFLVKLHVREIA